ncbi:hypothetical protein BST61_g243 [Cercospora zeina]
MRGQYSYGAGQHHGWSWPDNRQQHPASTSLRTALAYPSYALDCTQHAPYGPFVPQPPPIYSSFAAHAQRPHVNSNLSATAAAFVPSQPTKLVPLPVLDTLRRIDKSFRYHTKAGDNAPAPANSEEPKKLSKKQTAAARAREQAGARTRSRPLAAPGRLQQTSLLGYVKQDSSNDTSKAAQPKPRGGTSTAAQSKQRNNKVPRLQVMERPTPSQLYMQLASQTPQQLSTPRALLVVADLNGTLLKRWKYSGTNNSTLRPHVHDFLNYVLANHKLMIWSSARPQNVQVMCQKLFTPEQRQKLVTIWARDTLRLSPKAYDQRVQVYKELSWIWNDSAVQATNPQRQNEMWSQTNTVLIDDSIDKAASEPHNLVEVEEFEAFDRQITSDTYLLEAKTYLQTLSRQGDVSAYMRARPFKHSAVSQVSDQTPAAPRHILFSD